MPQTAVILSHGPTVLNGLELSRCPRFFCHRGPDPRRVPGGAPRLVGVKQVACLRALDDPSISRTIEDLLNPFPFQTRWRCSGERPGNGRNFEGTGAVHRWEVLACRGRPLPFCRPGRDALPAQGKRFLRNGRGLRVEESGWEMERLEPAPTPGSRPSTGFIPPMTAGATAAGRDLSLERFVLDHIRHRGYFDVKEQLSPTLQAGSSHSGLGDMRLFQEPLGAGQVL